MPSEILALKREETFIDKRVHIKAPKRFPWNRIPFTPEI